ncbi:MAG: 2OG-Fe(II) oxygenase [Gammaproteobacteria bacterium]
MPLSALTHGRLPPADDALFERIATALETRGLAVLPDALPADVAAALADDLAQRDARRFHAAGTGRGPDSATNPFVRRGRIAWIDERDPAARRWVEWTGELRNYLNRRLFLGLFSFESHFTHYAPGDFYKRHLDAFKGQSNRVLSLVTYLNPGWLPDQGGELVVYDPDDATPPLRVAPTCGTLVVFLSEVFPHEVLPAARTRVGVAGWFRVNTSLNGHLDPPR